jgi:hypothetical protein
VRLPRFTLVTLAHNRDGSTLQLAYLSAIGSNVIVVNGTGLEADVRY